MILISTVWTIITASDMEFVVVKIGKKRMTKLRVAHGGAMASHDPYSQWAYSSLHGTVSSFISGLHLCVIPQMNPLPFCLPPKLPINP